MPKKPPKNGFFYFMIEYKKNEDSRGRGISLTQASEKAGVKWQKMNAEQRAPYEEKAKKNRDNHGEKLTAQGIPYSQVEAQKRERETKVLGHHQRLRTTLQQATKRNALDKQIFYFIAFAYFCEDTEGNFIPAEMAVVRFNLERGVHDKLHVRIDPQRLPIGMAYLAMKHAEEDHQLPVPPNAKGETDLNMITSLLLSFLGQDGSGELPMLFTDRDDVAKLKCSTESFGLDVKLFGSVHRAQQLITRDIYDYTAGIACDDHEAMDNVKNCPLSRCVRWAYVIADNCCLDLGIDLQPGRHVPSNANTSSQFASGTSTGGYTTGSADDEDTTSYVSGSYVSRMTYPSLVQSGSLASRASSSRNAWEGSNDSKVGLKETFKQEPNWPELPTSRLTRKNDPEHGNTHEPVAGRSQPEDDTWSVVSKGSSRGRGRGIMLPDFLSLGGAGRGKIPK
ncbi:protein maelstrom homolog isoform X2 [Anopheles cruzii]|uniref:protein maelstrom homolog isoform X2 n=1 Tax=Anopheles cruzii TaxID=68878 RepID=UPI0022EC8288|nr:protein maelstrom homolog isoform X2 [Anopheles cruzii]